MARPRKTNDNGNGHTDDAPKRGRGRPAAPRASEENFTPDLFAEAWEEVQELEKNKSTGDSNLSGFYSRREKQGMHRPAFQQVRKLAKKDVQQIAAFHRNYLRYMEESGMLEQLEAHDRDLMTIAETKAAA